MALHVREQITVAAVSALTGLTTTGSRVYRDRDTEANPLQATEVPGLTVDDDGDPSEVITIDAAQTMERRMALRVTAHVKAASGTSALLNKILKEVEIAIAGATLTGAKFASLAGVGPRDKSQAAEQPTLRQSFHFEIVYYTAPAAPDTAL